MERPGRVDLAAQIDKPDVEARHQLLQLYAGDLDLNPATLRRVAERTEGTTASFAKEPIRRCVLNAAEHDVPADDTHLLASMEDEV